MTFPGMAKGLMALLCLTLAACDPDPETSPAPVPGSSSADGRASLESALASLPTGLWSVRLIGGVAEAVVSNGDANIGFSCPDGRLVIRYRPTPVPSGATLTLTARGNQSAAVDVPFSPAGNRDLTWAGSAEGAAGPFLRSLARNATLAISGDSRLAASFPGTGAGEALMSALSPQGCLAG
ncbi:MAG: hypothetical protein AAF416_06875 [Pseudomonadota bacterium]